MARAIDLKKLSTLVSKYKRSGYFQGLEDDIKFLVLKASSPKARGESIKFVGGRKLRSGKPYWHVRKLIGQRKDYWSRTSPVRRIVARSWLHKRKLSNFKMLIESLVKHRVRYVKAVTIYDLAFRLSFFLKIPLDGLYVKAGSKRGLLKFSAHLSGCEIPKDAEWLTPLSREIDIYSVATSNHDAQLKVLLRKMDEIEKCFKSNSFAHVENFLCWYARTQRNK